MTVPSSSVAFSSTGQWSRKRLLVSPEPASGAGGLDIRIYPSAVIGATSNAGIGVAIVIFLILWFAIIIGSLVMMIVALVDIVRRPDWQWKMAGQEKVLWLLLVILVNFLAIPSLIYWFNIRKKLKTVEDRAASGHYGPGHMTYSGWEPVPFPFRSPTQAWHQPVGIQTPVAKITSAGGMGPDGRITPRMASAPLSETFHRSDKGHFPTPRSRPRRG